MTDILSRQAVLDYGSKLIGADRGVLHTGLKSLDEACVQTGGIGLANGWYTVIGGASASGKTRLMYYLARQAAEQGRSPGIITMEVPIEGIQRSVYANVTKFSYYDFLPDHWEDDPLESPVEKMAKLADEVDGYTQGLLNLHVHEFERSPTLFDIESACHAMKEEGCKVIFLDHLQLIKSGAKEIVDKATEVSESLRMFAHRERILVIALSQLNRMASRERHTSPTMHDLWGGTSIESNSNMVLLLDHSRVFYAPKTPHILQTWLLLDKQRDGPQKIQVPVEVNFRTGAWREAYPDEVSGWPTHKGAR